MKQHTHQDEERRQAAAHGPSRGPDVAGFPATTVIGAAMGDWDPGRAGAAGVGRSLEALGASAGNGAVARLLDGGHVTRDVHRSAPRLAAGRATVQASDDEEESGPTPEDTADAAATPAEVPADGEAAGELAAGAPTPGPSWTKVGPPTPKTYSVSGSLRDVATTIAARPEAGSVTATASRSLDSWTPPGGSETVLAARVTVAQEVELPTWTDKSSATKNQQAEWDRFHAAITTHENGHVSTDKTSFAGTHTTMLGSTEAVADTKLTEAETRATTDNAAYDTTTKSGLAQGTGINANIDEVTKVP